MSAQTSKLFRSPLLAISRSVTFNRDLRYSARLLAGQVQKYRADRHSQVAHASTS